MSGKGTPIKILLLATLISIGNIIFAQEILWSDEAENGALTGSADIVEGCANASGGKFVRLQNVAGNSLAFNHISITNAGEYLLKVYYFYNAVQPLNILVNAESSGIQYFPGATWCYEGPAAVYLIKIQLIEGDNSIEFRSALEKSAPFLDRIEILDLVPAKVNISASSDRVLPMQELILEIVTSDLVPEEETVEILVSGIHYDSYILSDTIITIQAGKRSGTTSFTYIDTISFPELNPIISLTNPSAGLELGADTSLVIHVVEGPSLFHVSSSSGKDLNDGLSSDTPWKTLEKVNHFSFIPGDRILFKAGDRFNGQLVVNSSGNRENPIIFSRFGEGAKPVINGAMGSDGDHLSAILIQNREYIEIEELEITNDRKLSRNGVSDSDGYGIMVWNSGDKVMQHFVFKNLTIHDIYAVSTESLEFNSIRVSGIFFRSERNMEVGKEKHIRDVLVDSCYIARSGRFGIYTQHAGGNAGIGNDSINRNMNLVFSNNHTFETGGSGITPGRCYNCLLENNTFEFPGSDADPRMTKRGSGAWFWDCRNVIAQYNRSLHVRGEKDSYGMHIDFGNRNVILQYNYSEDSEGGFVEILGNNVNSVYRFNVSVNDGTRSEKGRSLWVSTYAGTGIQIPSDSTYIYNNTVYVDANISPDIYLEGGNTSIYNNIFYATGNGSIGEQVTILTSQGSEYAMANNLFFGNVTQDFSDYDTNPLFGDPWFSEPGALKSTGYRLNLGSNALDAGTTFPEPLFHMAGKGIFKEVKPYAEADLFGNSVDLSDTPTHIGAYNGDALDALSNTFQRSGLQYKPIIYPNPASSQVTLDYISQTEGLLGIYLVDLWGKKVLDQNVRIYEGFNTLSINLKTIQNSGIYIFHLNDGKTINTSKLVIK